MFQVRSDCAKLAEAQASSRQKRKGKAVIQQPQISTTPIPLPSYISGIPSTAGRQSEAGETIVTRQDRKLLASASEKWEAKKALPNIHQGLHFPEVVEEYGALNMVFTLLGEDKHKYFFSSLSIASSS